MWSTNGNECISRPIRVSVQRSTRSYLISLHILKGGPLHSFLNHSSPIKTILTASFLTNTNPPETMPNHQHTPAPTSRPRNCICTCKYRLRHPPITSPRAENPTPPAYTPSPPSKPTTTAEKPAAPSESKPQPPASKSKLRRLCKWVRERICGVSWDKREKEEEEEKEPLVVNAAAVSVDGEGEKEREEVVEWMEVLW